MKISEEIAQKAKVVYKDTYIGFINFEFEFGVFKDKIIFKVNTRKGIKEARKLAAAGLKTIVYCSHCDYKEEAKQWILGVPLCDSCVKKFAKTLN